MVERRLVRLVPGITETRRKGQLFSGIMGKRVYRPAKFGEGMKPGTVEWELTRRRVQRQRRQDDAEFERRLAENEKDEPMGFWRIFAAVIRFFRTPN